MPSSAASICPITASRCSRRLSEYIRTTGSRYLRTLGLAQPQLDPRFQQTVTLAQNLGDFNILAGNAFELLTDYHGTIDRAGRRHRCRPDARASALLHLRRRRDGATRRGRRWPAPCRPRRRLPRADGRLAAPKRWLKACCRGCRRPASRSHAMMPVGWFRRSAARFDLRNHRKIAVIDGQIAYLGSQNLVDRRLQGRDHLRGTGVPNDRAGGRCRCRRSSAPTGIWRRTKRGPRRSYFPQPEHVGKSPAQLLPSGPGFPRANKHRLIVALVHGAQQRVVITTPYFDPGRTLLLRRCKRPCSAASRFTWSSPTRPTSFWSSLAQRSFYEELLDAGVQIHLYHAQFPARQAPEHRRRHHPDRLEQHGHPLVRAERRGQRADLRCGSGVAHAARAGPVSVALPTADPGGVGPPPAAREGDAEHRATGGRGVVRSREKFNLRITSC